MGRIISILAVILAFATACRPPQDGSSSRASSDLTLATVVPIGEVKPFSSRQGVGANLVELLYRPLFRFSKGGVIEPELVQSFEWKDGGKDLRITLEAGQVDNVQYTLDYVRKLPIPEFKEGLKNLKSIERVSDTELVFHLEEFDRIFPFLLSQIPILSKTSGETTGDFKIESQKEEEVVLSRKVPSSSGVNRIIVKQISSPRRVIREFVAGNVDLSFLTDEAAAEVLSDIKDLGFGELESSFLYFVLVNRRRDDLDKLRWADIGANLDRADMIKQLEMKGLVEASVPVKPGSLWSSVNFPVPTKNAIAVGNLRTLSLSFLNTQSTESRIALLLKRHLEEMGIPISLNHLNPQEFGQRILQSKDFDLVLLPYAMKDALSSIYLVFHSAEEEGSVNLTGYSNKQVDRRLEEARNAYDDVAARQAFSSAMEEMMKDPPGIFLFWLKTPILYRKSCSGFKFNTNDFFSSLKDVRCEPSAVN